MHLPFRSWFVLSEGKAQRAGNESGNHVIALHTKIRKSIIFFFAKKGLQFTTADYGNHFYPKKKQTKNVQTFF